ncbi:hypothetical protein IQ273_12505 [Nodosilinea sp. LEGE 07298]|uniref:hypothetical protein n=1 Tax=Nodosilinea sp. LEGE 07298 TaxID=2777970 RepID=UPI00187FC0F9|nr:hypothetical protein [Nodosilinea sp. LEGE 07298]MBE9110233.1 hypothetical protein [Nodosilinea sp. LEGE 07298]
MPKPDIPALPNDLSVLDLTSGSEAVDSRLNAAQMLSLIDSILPFEACLYHEIIPLSVESSCLHLGMVNPTDTTAVDYARKQVSFIHCSVVSWPVSSDWQRKMLSKYLSYASRTKPRSQAPATNPLSPQAAPSSDELLTFIVDSPDHLQSDRPAQPATASRPIIPPPVAPESHPLSITLNSALGQIPLNQLHRLPPPQLTQALLNQVLTEGIGRLYLERYPTQGRVLWSKDGVVQAALDDLSSEQIQSVINELKRLTHLPLLPTSQPKQADIERLHKGDRVLLRLRLMAGTHGEEATLQVLRGAALKFYEQQQIRQLGEEALGVAHTLQKRISAIRHRAQQTLTIEAPSARTLDDLMQMLKTMEEQIEQIIESSAQSDASKLL